MHHGPARRARLSFVASDELHWYEADELEEIPTSPGLYAWYAVPVAGPLDWQPEHDDDGNDLGSQNFGSFLAKHTHRLRSPTLAVQAKGHLWAAWSGSLTEAGTQTLAEHLDQLGGPEAQGPGAKLKWALHNSDARQVLASVLVAASPRLSSPIYIGVAKNLRERLGTHIDNFNAAAELLGTDAALPSELRNKFGGRVAEAGLALDDLRIAALPVPEFAGLSDIDLRNIAEAAEFVLNRWHHPLFGER